MLYLPQNPHDFLHWIFIRSGYFVQYSFLEKSLQVAYWSAHKSSSVKSITNTVKILSPTLSESSQAKLSRGSKISRGIFISGEKLIRLY